MELDSNHIKRKKRLNHKKELALGVLFILIIAFIHSCRANGPFEPRITDFTASPSTVDVNEPVNFTWTIIGSFDIAIVSFGDGNQTEMTMTQENDTYTIIHRYAVEGKYNASIYVANTLTGDEDWDARFITVQNDPPRFGLQIPSQAEEDELVNISVINLQESDHDKKPGVLSYVYDFADGNQTTINSSSIVHKWANVGIYPITVTVIDDQGALNQRTQNINITNKDPEPEFTIGSEIPATYGFYSDLVGAFPFGWSSIDKHYEATFSFENDTNGQDPSGFIDTSEGACDVSIYGELNGHKKIARLHDIDGYVARMENSITQISGVIEFWIYTDDISRVSAISIQDGGFSDEIWFGFKDGEFQYYNGSYQSIYSASSNKWYHIKIEFDVTSDWHLWINGESMDNNTGYSFRGVPTLMDKVIFVTDGSVSNYNLYVDAIGYSWDSEYKIGDNVNAHESYDAFTVQEGADHHQKILQIEAQGFHDAQMYNTFSSQPNGTVEYWFMPTNVSQPVGVFSFQDSYKVEQFAIFIKNGKWHHRAGGEDIQVPNVNDAINDVWHHVRIDFLTSGEYMDLDPNTFQIIIDEIESGLINFAGNEIERINVSADSDFAGIKAFVDAIGYSWDPNYKVGYNLHIFDKEYYGTFDFSGEIVGTEPSEEDWRLDAPVDPKDGSFTIFDGGYKVGEVVEIVDNTTETLMMEHNYTDQTYGSVEFWVMTNDPSAKTWVFCLMQNNYLAFAVLMDDDKWKYTLNDIQYNDIENVSTPEYNTWYHVRIDFRCLGADSYFSLQEQKFMVSIDTIASPQYTFNSLSSVNRTRITTGGVDTGEAYIDAIGYSWDPYYEIGDNRFPAVHYPEKSLIWFSASLTIDSASDINSLSYFWDFGDGAVDFGKYISHEYVTSGTYHVNLTVMDDNGVKKSKVRTVLIGNNYPDINFSSLLESITTYEGTTVTFDTIIADESADVSLMEYYWYLNGPEFDPYNVTLYQQGGWVNSYTFTDDHNGTLYALALDPEGAFDFDSLNVSVLNVAPEVSICSADITGNITLEVERSGPPYYDNNYTVLIVGTDKFGLSFPYIYKTLNFTGSEENIVNFKEEDTILSLLKNWTVLVNTTSPISGTVQYTITLEFQDGKQEVIQSGLYSSSYAYWETVLNPMWYDETNFTIKHPVDIGVSIWDPSDDDITLNLNYTVDMLLEVQCTDSLPIIKSFNISDTFFYDVYIYESEGKIYANISAYTQIAPFDEFNDYEFPIYIDTTYTIYPMIEIIELLVNRPDGPQLNGFSVLDCIKAINFLDAFAEDDDGGTHFVSVEFYTQDSESIKIMDLCPDIDLINNNGGLMMKNLTFYLDYYYKSHYQSNTSFVFESVSILGDTEQQGSSSDYGNQVSDTGSGGDSGYISINQLIDSQNDLDSVQPWNEIGPPITINGNDTGIGFNNHWQDTITNQSTDSMYYDPGNSYTTGYYYYTRNTDEIVDSWTHSMDHYPGNPGESFYGDNGNPNGWNCADANGYVDVYSGAVEGHEYIAEIYYDGSGSTTSYMYRTVGEKPNGELEFWIYTNGAHGKLTLYDGGNVDIKFRFNENGLYYRNHGFFGWEWKLWTNLYHDSDWFRIHLRWFDDINTFDLFLYDKDNDRIFEKYSVESESGGDPDKYEFSVINSDNGGDSGSFYIDGYGERFNNYVEGQNEYPHQDCYKYIYNVPLSGLDKDEQTRATAVEFKVRFKIFYNPEGHYFKESPDFRIYVLHSDSTYDLVYLLEDPGRDTWYETSYISIGNSYCYGDQDLDILFTARVEYFNDPNAPYTMTIDWIKTRWQETYRINTNKYYYYDPSQEASIEHTLNLGCNNFKRDHATFDFELKWHTSFAKTYYVDLYDYSVGDWHYNIHSSYWSGPYNLGDNQDGEVPLTSISLNYIEDDESPRLKYKLRTTGGGNPFEVEFQFGKVHWSYSYTYWAKYEIVLSDMTQFRYETFDYDGDGCVLNFIYTDVTRIGGTIRYSLKDWNSGQFVEFDNDDYIIDSSRFDTLQFWNKKYINPNNYTVRVYLDILNHDTECELGVVISGFHEVPTQPGDFIINEIDPEIGWWKLDYGQGTTAYDYIGDNDGTINSATWVNGKIGKALDFDSSDYVSIPHDSSIDPRYTWTLAAWIKRDAMGVQHSIIEKYDWILSRGGFGMRVASDDKLHVFHVSGQSSEEIISTTTINSGQWYFVAGTYDTYTDRIRLYVNGELEADEQATLQDLWTLYPLYIGARGNDHATNFNGIIDDTRLYDYALSDDQISWLYNSGVGRDKSLSIMYLTSQGDLEFIDGDYSIMSSVDIGDYTTFEILPDSDTGPNQWDGATPHYQLVDNGDEPGSDYVIETYPLGGPDPSGSLETFGFDNPDLQGQTIQKIEVITYGEAGPYAGVYPKVNLYDGSSWLGWQSVYWPFNPINPPYREVNTYSNLNLGQTAANNLQVQFMSDTPSFPCSNWLYSVFLVLYVMTIYSDELEVKIGMKADDPDVLSVDYLKYSHRTNVAVDIDLDIWNWQSESWYEIESVTNTVNFNDDSFTLGAGSPYVSFSFEVRIRFQGSHTSSFQLELDRLLLEYSKVNENDGLTHEYYWDSSYHDTFSIELLDMNPFRYNDAHFKLCEVFYAVDMADYFASDPQTINVLVYNHDTQQWDTLDYISTYDHIEKQGSFIFYDNKYIYYEQSSGKYFINISFSGFTDPYEVQFKCKDLYAEWDYSYTWDDQFEISLTNMNDFRYDQFEQCTISYTISTESAEPVNIYLWNYTASNWVQMTTVYSGSSYSDSLIFLSNAFVDSTTYKVKIWFELAEYNPPGSYANSNFTLDTLSASWHYNFTYYPVSQLQLDQLNAFRYEYFDECTIDYQFDLPRAGESTNVYLYNFSGGVWEYFKTTVGGAENIQDSIIFSSTDYIESGTYNVRINFTGFSDTEFYKDSITATYNWEYEVQDRYKIFLNDMTPHRYDAFESCNITYSIHTTANQSNLQIKLYNFTSLTWVLVGDPFSTIANTDYNGSVVFISNEFIHPSEYKTRVLFSGIEDSFLTLNWMVNNYTWSHYYIYCDFGYDGQGMEAIPYANMSSIYRNVYSVFESFDHAGMYVITWTASNGALQTTRGELIEIIYPIPTISIGDLPDYIIEDQQVYLESKIYFSEEFAQEAEYCFFWDFGDGHFSVDRNPIHAWAESGNYTVVLHVRDLYGNYYNYTTIIEVHEKYPEIVGSCVFYGIEGQAIVLDIDVSDSLFDRKDLSFTWFDQYNQEITEFKNNPKPTVIFNDGEYTYKLEIEDKSGYTIYKNISIIVDDTPPIVTITNYMYHGDVDSGTLTLRAYAFDYYGDVNTLEFTWRIAHNGSVDNRGPYGPANRSSILFNTVKTAIYQGQVDVRDPSTDMTSVATFYIYSVIDSNGNGFSDEFEAELAENGEHIYDYYDFDRDGLSNLYELTYNITDYLNPDSDGDGLYDGIDRLTGIGERTAGTNPADYDSDDDLLSDGYEVFGWNINTDREGELHVTSDPWLNDTDNDGWSDYEEFIADTNPRNPDTDVDGLVDSVDPYPLKADEDEDGLLDGEEISIGTDYDNSDTDGDGLSDFEEVVGWGMAIDGTNPLSADTDHDFIPDNAETIKKHTSIRNRMDLDASVIIGFDQYFMKAVSAHISFSIAFGEADDTINYGIQNVPNLRIQVKKIDNNLVLYEGETGGNRYFSQTIDFREQIESNGYNYFGQYTIAIDKINSGCLLEQFDIDIQGYLNPNDADSDNDGIMDGVEIDLLTRGKNTIDFAYEYASNDITINSIITPPFNFHLEVGSLVLSNTIDQSIVESVEFESPYRIPPIIVAYINSRNEDESVEVRIDNVTASGFNIFMEEPDNDSHANEIINYIAIEPGEWELPDGAIIKAGRIFTNKSHQGSNPYNNWEIIGFNTPFGNVPVVLHSLNTYNNKAFKASIVSDVSASSFKVQQESGETGTNSEKETIGWIAIEAGRIGTIKNVKYETIRENDCNNDGVDDGGHAFQFQQSFSSAPDIIVVSQNTANNEDGSWARSDGALTPSTHITNAEEDQIGDSERSSPDEYFGMVAFESSFSYGFYMSKDQPEGDFKIIRGTTTFGASDTTVTIIEGSDYKLESTTAFIRITDTRFTAMGEISTGGNQNHDTWGARIQNPENIATSITFERFDTTTIECRITWEIIQYTGLTGGGNEFIVRDVGTATCSGDTISCEGALISSIINPDKVAVFITGQYAVTSGRGDIWRALFTADLIDLGGGFHTPRFTRGKSDSTTDGVSYAVVEFVGLNWADVQRLEISTECSTAWTTSNYDTAYADVSIESEGGADLTNYTRAFMHQQFRTDNDATGLDDAGDNVEIISNTHLRIRNSATSGNRYKVCWIIENLQSTGTPMSVQHGWFFKSTGGSEENLWTEDITKVRSMDTTSVFAQASMDGTGTAFPRGTIDYRLSSTSQVTFTESDNGQEKLVSYSVVQWPTEPIEEPAEEEEEEEPNKQIYFIAISDIGRVYDANITIEIISENTPFGYGIINITLVKEDISSLIDDVVLIEYDTGFNHTDVYFYKFLDLTEYVNNESINQFYGNYRLEIILFNNNTNDDVFNVTKFFIETDTYIQASVNDKDAWITDPLRADSDGDTISDYNEIYGWTRGSQTFFTNPVSKDTDGDNARDDKDRHPNKNMMLKISPWTATHRNQYYWEDSPWLEIVIRFSIMGSSGGEEDYYILSQAVQATEDYWSWEDPFGKIWDHFRRSNFHMWNMGEGVHYYVDIDDHINRQPENIELSLSLWQMNREDSLGNDIWDLWLAGGSETYSIGDIGYSDFIDVSYTGPWDNENEAHVRVETFAVEKSNTIAIYRNDTVFNGHYQEKEKMNIFILYVQDYASNFEGTPFEEGPNAILIPTSLFTQTKLNGYLEREELDQTPLYSGVPEEFEFISVGRNGTTEEGCDEVDFVVIRYNINVADAMAVLDLLIIVIVNDTTQEEVELFKYQSTKENGASATLMNLYKEVLGYIPWYCDFIDSEQGEEPHDFDEWLAEQFISAIMTVIYVFYMIGMAIVQLFAAIVRFIGEILMAVLSFLGPLLWLIIRAVLLVLIYIFLALEIATTVGMISVLGLSLMVFGGLFGVTYAWGLNPIVLYAVDTKVGFIELHSEDTDLRLESWIKWTYWEYFDLYIPAPHIDFDIGNLFDSLESENGPPKVLSGFNETDTLEYDFYTTYSDDGGDPPEYVKVWLIPPKGDINDAISYTMQRHPDYDEYDFNDEDVAKNFYKTGVKYNITIDFATEFTQSERGGQWFYYFEAKDDPSEGVGTVVYWPTTTRFEVGPNLIDDSQVGDYLIYSGIEPLDGIVWEPDILNFTVTGLEVDNGIFPNRVDITLLFPDGTFEIFEMTNISAFKDEYEESSYYGRWFTKYFVSLNLSEYYDFNRISSYVGYYFNATLSNGKNSILLGSGYNSYAEESTKTFYNAFIKAIEKDGKPKIITYKVEELTDPRSWDYELTRDFPDGRYSTIQPFYSEDFLRFWVWIRDEDATHEETYEQTPNNFTFTPQLTLTKIGGESFTLDMAWAGYDDYIDADMYYVDLSGLGDYSYEWNVDEETGEGDWNKTIFGPGTWRFEFDVEDNDANQAETLYSNHRIWHFGSASHFWETFWGGGLTSSSAPSWLQSFGMIRPIITVGGFLVSVGLQKLGKRSGDVKYQIASMLTSIATLGFDAISKMTAIASMIKEEDSGALFGVSLNLLITVLMTTLATSFMGLRDWKLGSMSSIFGFLNAKRNAIFSKFIAVFRIVAVLNYIFALINNPDALFGASMVLMFALMGGLFDLSGIGKSILILLPFAMSFGAIFGDLAGVDFDENWAGDMIQPFLDGIAHFASMPWQITALILESLGIGVLLSYVGEVKGGLTTVAGKFAIFDQFEPATTGLMTFSIFNTMLATFCLAKFLSISGLFHSILGLRFDTAHSDNEIVIEDSLYLI